MTRRLWVRILSVGWLVLMVFGWYILEAGRVWASSGWHLAFTLLMIFIFDSQLFFTVYLVLTEDPVDRILANELETANYAMDEAVVDPRSVNVHERYQTKAPKGAR